MDKGGGGGGWTTGGVRVGAKLFGPYARCSLDKGVAYTKWGGG